MGSCQFQYPFVGKHRSCRRVSETSFSTSISNHHFCLLFMIAGYAEFVGSIHQVSLRLHVLPQIMRWSPFPPPISKRRKRIFRCRPDEIPHTQNKKRRLVRLWPYARRCSNKQFHTGPELSDGNSELTLVRGASQCVI